jgi:membrane dipeptidase
MKVSTKPIVASHSNSFSVCPHKRNLTDEQFLNIKKTGGLVGVTFCKDFLNPDPQKASAVDVLRHVEHFLELGGEETLCLGSDFDGADVPNDIMGIQTMGSLYELFLKHYKQSTVDAIFFQNAAGFRRW